MCYQSYNSPYVRSLIFESWMLILYSIRQKLISSFTFSQSFFEKISARSSGHHAASNYNIGVPASEIQKSNTHIYVFFALLKQKTLWLNNLYPLGAVSLKQAVFELPNIREHKMLWTVQKTDNIYFLSIVWEEHLRETIIAS